MRGSLWMFIGLLIAVSFACAPQEPENLGDPGEIRAAAVAFLDYAHTFDYEAMRANATADFEILIFGRRMDMDAFETLLRRMEKEREGRPLGSYELADVNTEIVGDVAYRTWASPNWLESAIFIRTGDRWLMDRAASIRVADPER